MDSDNIELNTVREEDVSLQCTSSMPLLILNESSISLFGFSQRTPSMSMAQLGVGEAIGLRLWSPTFLFLNYGFAPSCGTSRYQKGRFQR